MKKVAEILSELKEKDIWDRNRAGLPNDAEIDEALAELQELTQDKSCEKCKHAYINPCTGNKYNLPSIINMPKAINHWSYCKELSINIAKDFYCKHYTPKG